MRSVTILVIISCILFLIFCTGTTESRRHERHGSRSKKVLGGTKAAKKQFPWQVGITCCNKADTSCEKCGGSLITRKHVLTAAHCTDKKYKFTLRFGAINWFESEVKVDALDFVQHKKYDSVNLINDIAVIKMISKIRLSPSIQLIPLAPANIGDLSDETGIASGYGKIAGMNDFFSLGKFLKL